MAKVKWNYENMKNFVEKYKFIILTGTEEYYNSESYINIKCNRDHITRIKFRKFLENPSECKQCEKYEKIKNFVEIESHSGCKLLSTEYIDNKTIMEFQCSCGNTFKRNYHNFKDAKQYLCDECSNKNKSTTRLSNTYDSSVSLLKHMGYTPLDSKEEYKGIRKKSNIRCDNNHTIEMSIDAIKQGHICSCCSYENVSNENHWNWQGGITNINDKIRNSKEYENWRIEVFEKDNYTCQCCGDNKGGNLEAHHIKNFSDNKELRFDVDNGITMCNSCHNPNQIGSFHHMYGTNNNTKEQLKNYLLFVRGGDVQ